MAKSLTLQEKSTDLQVSTIKILNFLENDLLAYSQLSSGNFRKNFSQFSLIDSVNEIINLMRYKADEVGIELVLDVDGFENYQIEPNQIITSSEPLKLECSDYVINFDEQRLQQILLNLISNALKFTP